MDGDQPEESDVVTFERFIYSGFNDWLDALNVPEAPMEGAAANLWYRLGWLANDYGTRACSDDEVTSDDIADQTAHNVITSVADSLAEALGMEPDRTIDPYERFKATLQFLSSLDVTMDLDEPAGPTADPWAARDDDTPHVPDQWRPPSETPAVGAVVDIERGNAGGGPSLGMLTGEAQIVQDATGANRLAVMHGDDLQDAVIWDRAAIKRWRFAASATP